MTRATLFIAAVLFGAIVGRGLVLMADTVNQLLICEMPLEGPPKCH